MPSRDAEPIWKGDTATAPEVARLLVAFNAEFETPSPDAAFLAERIAALIEAGEIEVLLCGEPAVGFGILRFNQALYDDAFDSHIDELYVVPERRGRGLGRALLDALLDAARARGATHVDLGTATDDTAARALYESAGFTNLEDSAGGPSMLYYERDL